MRLETSPQVRRNKRAGLFGDLVQSSRVDKVALRYDTRESLYTQQAQKLQVFERLWHRPVVCRHHQHAGRCH